MTRKPVTGIGSADRPVPELVADVVGEAVARAGGVVQGVILFLSQDYARHVQPAMLAASRAARCLQVSGCTAGGVFTEADWIMDRPAAAAMVFPGPVVPSHQAEGDAPRLSLATPHGATPEWIASPAPRFGMLSTDGPSRGPGRIWSCGKSLEAERLDLSLVGARLAIGVSRGLRVLSTPAEVSEADGFDVLRLGNHPALTTLLRELPIEFREQEQLPMGVLFAAVLSGDDPAGVGNDFLDNGLFRLIPVLGANHGERSVTLATRVDPGRRLAWLMLQPVAAESDTRQALDRAADELGAPPEFALVFSCMGRGPWFYGGRDRDWDALRQRFPGLPLVGAYGGGEIAPLPPGNTILHNSAVFALGRSL